MIEYPAVFNNSTSLGRLCIVDQDEESVNKFMGFPQALISIKPEDIDISRIRVDDIQAMTTLAHFGVDIHSRSLEIENPHMQPDIRSQLVNIEKLIEYVANKFDMDPYKVDIQRQILAWLNEVSSGSILLTGSRIPKPTNWPPEEPPFSYLFSPTPTKVLDSLETDQTGGALISNFKDAGLLFEVEFDGKQYYISDPVINLAFRNIPTSD
jgi:hypothetical protein